MPRSRTYRSWEAMRRRCMAPQSPDFPLYGAKGIRICERWNSFAHFLADMGERPEGTTLDRIDSAGDYTPENCRWATNTQQLRNRSCVVRSIETAREIRTRYAAGGITQRALAAEFGTCTSIISRIVTHKIWREEVV